MGYRGFINRLSIVGLCIFVLIAGQGHSIAGSDADKVEKMVLNTLEVLQETQRREDEWAGKRAELKARYRSLIRGNSQLEKEKQWIEQALKRQRQILERQRRKIEESARIQEELQSCLGSIVARLEEFIKKDLPFLQKERSKRISMIKEILASPDRPASEKYRRVMEALEIESRYGRTVEVYEDTVVLDGQTVVVEILRVGRLSLFCQTPDGRTTGHYDRVLKRWVSLPSRYHREISKAMEMARKERAIDLVRLPIGRIVPNPDP